MEKKRYFLLLLFIAIALSEITAQNDRLAYFFTGVVYDEHFRPLPYTHVLARGTGVGDVTDSLGVFALYVRKNDQLSFYNISFQDTSRFVSSEDKGFSIILRKRYYSLKEARVYNWGSSYDDFIDEVKRQGDVVTEGEKIGLPTQDPDYIPFDRDEEKIKSLGFFIHSPLSSLYYNYNKQEKAARRAYQLEKDKALIDTFERILGVENISYITELKGDELVQFMFYLNDHLSCTYHCSELRLLTEIHSIWKRYLSL